MLFKDTIRLKAYAEFTEINFQSIAPTIRMVEQVNLLPLIGAELYGTLNAAYNAADDESTLSAANAALLDQCRQVIAPYIIYNYTPKADIMLSDSGARRAETGTMKTSFNYQTINFRAQKLQEAQVAEEMLLGFLEINKGDYPTWVSSPAFTRYRSLFVKSGQEFNECFSSQSPYRVYNAVRAKMVDVEQMNIRPAITSAVFNDLKTKNSNPTYTFTEDEAQLVYMLKRAISYMAVAFAVPYLAVQIDTNGITVVSGKDITENKDSKLRQDATEKAKQALATSAAATGREWLTNATNFLTDNYASFPLWPAPTPPPPDAQTPNPDTATQFDGSFGFV